MMQKSVAWKQKKSLNIKINVCFITLKRIYSQYRYAILTKKMLQSIFVFAYAFLPFYKFH